ncbi:MAG: hypothetical protein II875_14625 [Clostridia bacterium]|nr:hypothetical protein [Clostridia bacterium]
MSEIKRVTGSGKAPYVWKDPKRTPQPPRRKPVYRSKKRTIETGKTMHAVVAVLVAAVLIITAVSLFNLSAEKSRLESLKRRHQELSESVESTERTLALETRSQVICQLAEERLYMVRAGEANTVTVPSFGGDIMTAGR